MPVEREPESTGSEAILLPERPKEKPKEPPPPEPFCAHPDNWQSYQIFESCRTQWRWVSSLRGVVREGINYPSVISVMQIMVKPKHHKRVLQNIRLMEAGALSVIYARQDVPDNATDSG